MKIFSIVIWGLGVCVFATDYPESMDNIVSIKK
jgi:hypothetical protein